MDFRRVDNLPPYVFAAIRDLTLELRRAGDDVVDLGFGNPDLPSPDLAVEKLARGGAEPAQPPLLGLEGDPEPPPRRGDAVQAQVRRRSRPRHAGAEHDRRQGRPLAPDVGAARARRLGARAEPELPDPHPRADPRGRVGDAGADGGGRGSVREPRGGLGARPAEAPRRRPLVPAQPDDRDRRPRVHGARRRVRPASTSCSSSTTSPTPTSRSTATSRPRSSRSRVRTRSRSSSTR